MTFGPDLSAMISAPTMLALVALLGYFVGCLRRWSGTSRRRKDRNEILRALTVSKEMEAITYRLRKSIAANIPAVEKFGSRLARLERSSGVSWVDLCDQADNLLKPVLKLSTEIAHAYGELLQQMSHLSTFAELRTDPLTGVANRRAFDESLESFLSQQARYAAPFSVAMLDIDLFKQINDQQGHLYGDRVLQDLATLLKVNVRDCDVLARYGGEEFVILMPQTELHAACSLTERIRTAVQVQLPVTVSMGVAASLPGDTADGVIARADKALYAAKTAGRNCVYLHEGLPERIVGIKTSPPKTQIADGEAAKTMWPSDDGQSFPTVPKSEQPAGAC